MTTLEVSNNQTDEILAGLEFSTARERLQQLHSKSRANVNEYEETLKDYINAAQAYYFETCPLRREKVINYVAHFIKGEVELISGQSIECVQDIQKRFDQYSQDDSAMLLKEMMIPRTPRGFSMVVLDLLDELRPNTYG